MEIGSIININVNDYFNQGNNDFYLPFMEGKKFSNNKLFNSGRSAIEYLFRELAIRTHKRTVLIPSYICNSVTEAINRAGFNYVFYSITKDLFPDIDSIKKEINNDIGFLYINHYFGTYTNSETLSMINKIRSYDIEIVEDISHALYTSDDKYIGFGDYVVGSIRKWLPIPDGGFISSKRQLAEFPTQSGINEYSFNYFIAQIMKTEYLKEPLLDKRQFLKYNSAAIEDLFMDYTIRDITNLSLSYISSYDMNKVIVKRKENFDFLFNESLEIEQLRPLFSRRNGEVPFGFIVQTQERDQLFEYLKLNSIYCNIHWSIGNGNTANDSVAKELSKTILTIPCDQRYGVEEMSYIIKVIKKYYKYNQKE